MKKFIAPLVVCLFTLFFFVGCTPTVRVEYANVVDEDILLLSFRDVPVYVPGSDLEYEKDCGTIAENFECFIEEYEAGAKLTLNPTQRLNVRAVVVPKLMHIGRRGWNVANKVEDAETLAQQYTLRHVNEIVAAIYR